MRLVRWGCFLQTSEAILEQVILSADINDFRKVDLLGMPQTRWRRLALMKQPQRNC